MTIENVIFQFEKYLSEKGITENKAIVEAAYSVLHDKPAKAGGVEWWVSEFKGTKTFVEQFVETADSLSVADKWATDYENGVAPKTVEEISALFVEYLTANEITDPAKIVEAAYDVLGGDLTPKAGGVAWWVGQKLTPEALAAEFIKVAGTLEQASKWADELESGEGEPGEPSSLTEALENLSEAEAGVAEALADAATAKLLDTNPKATEAEIEAFVKTYTLTQLEADLKAEAAKVAGEQAKVDGANAAVLTAGAQTFTAVATSGATQSTDTTVQADVAFAAALLTTGGPDALVNGTTHLTQSNIDKAVADAQAGVSTDTTKYIVLEAGTLATALGTVDHPEKLAWASSASAATKIAVGDALELVEVDATGIKTTASGAGSFAGYAIEVGSILYGTDGLAANGSNSFAETTKTLTARDLQNAVNSAEGALNAHVSAQGSDVELLESLRAAIAEYAKTGDIAATITNGQDNTGVSFAGILPSVAAAMNFTATNNDTIADLLAAITGVLASPAANLESNAKILVDALMGGVVAPATVNSPITVGTPGSETAAEKAINAALKNSFDRSDLYSKLDAADDSFVTTTSGNLLEAAETIQDAREGLKDEVTQAQAELEKVGTLVETLEALQADYKAAVKALDEAKEYFTEEGLELPVIVKGGVNGTSESDIFLVTGDSDGSTIGGFGLDGEDKLFVGKDFVLVELGSKDDLSKDRLGEADVLEIFVQKNGNNVDLFVEQEAFAGNAKSLDDLVKVTLTGVSVDELSLDADGFISIA